MAVKTQITSNLNPVSPFLAVPPAKSFDKGLSFTLRWEGGLSTDPRDPGNRGGQSTYRGVTQQAYNTYRKNQHLLPRSVELLTPEELRHLYKTEFYLSVRADKLPEKIGIALFDSAVNIGPGKAIRLLQRSLRVTEDGMVGPQTIAAAHSVPEQVAVERLLSLREDYYAHLGRSPRYRPFLRGWMNRCADLRKFLL